jgi:CheY-like chemotaxis protein
MGAILLVEDDAWMADCYALWLQADGHTVLRAGDAQAALDVLDEQPVDAIVLDVLLPHANGIQLLHTLRSHADFARLPVVLCSGSLPADLPPLQAYGVHEVIDKAQVGPQSFRQTIREVLNHAAV